MGSFLVCRHGGLIEPVTSGRENRETVPIQNNALGVKRQVYENNSTIAEGLRDVADGIRIREVISVRDDYGPWAENLALQYAKDRNMLEYNTDNAPITWDNEADALRHFAWSVRMTKELSEEKTEIIVSNHERHIFYKISSGYVRFIPLENLMDERNNEIGMEYADKLKGGDYGASAPYIELFAEAKNDGKLALTLDDVYRLDPGLDRSRETELEVKDLGVKRGLLFLCDRNKEITKQIDKDEAEILVKKYENTQEIILGMP
jgi:hypothetical protein